MPVGPAAYPGTSLRRVLKAMDSPSGPTYLAFDGSTVDGSWYTSVTDFARDTPWLNATMLAFTSYGIVVFAFLALFGWWIARHKDTRTMTAALAVPVAGVLAYVVNDGIKSVFAETRPCYALPRDFLLERCPPLSDYAFPSNHTSVTAACAAALFLVSWRLGAIGALATVLMAFSRVYVGAHYPHDVLGAILVGSIVGIVTALVLRRFAAPLVAKLRAGALRPVLTHAEP